MTKEQIDTALAVDSARQTCDQIKTQIAQVLRTKDQLPGMKARLETALAQPHVIAAAGEQLAALQEIVAGI